MEEDFSNGALFDVWDAEDWCVAGGDCWCGEDI